MIRVFIYIENSLSIALLSSKFTLRVHSSYFSLTPFTASLLPSILFITLVLIINILFKCVK